MKALSEIEIKYYENDVVKVRYKAPVTASAFVHYELMNSHYVKLSFHSAKAIGFRIGDFIELPNWGRFEIVEPVKPQYDGAEYTYEPQFEAYYRKWKNKKVRYIPESGFPEAYFTLTASILVHARIILRNLAYLVSKDKSYLFNRNYTSTDKDTIGDNNAVYGKTDFTIFVDSTVDVKKARNISYQNINILDAITQVASTFECEWWVTENVIHFGECKLEQKADVELKSGTNVASISSSPSTSNYFTRLLSFGAARNLPDTYKKDGITDVTKEGVVEQRLMLPTVDELIEYAATSDTAKAVVDKVNKELSDNGFELVGNYLQVKGLSEQQYIEGAVTNDDDYPKNIIEIGKVETYAKEVKNNATADENDTITRTYYRLSGLKLVNEDGVQIGEPEFLDKYILKGKDLSILFQSGSLNGLDFTCKFNPLGKPLYKMNSNGAFVDKDGNETTDKSKYVVNPESQCFEVCANENYGRTLPDPDLCPKVGDTFVLYNWDATMMPGNLIMEASVDLLLDTIEYLKKSMIDPTTYTATMLSDYVFKSKRYFSLGEAVKLNNPAFFTTPRDSRVIGYEIKLDIPWDSPQYIIGEKPSYSKIGDLAQRVSELAYNGKSYSGSGIGGTSVYIVTSNDNTPFSDTNTLSSLRAQKEFLSKTQDDTAQGLITFAKGFISDMLAKLNGGATFGTGGYKFDEKGNIVVNEAKSLEFDEALERGFGVTKNSRGKYTLSVTDLMVWGKAVFNSLEIRKLYAVGGNVYLSGASSKIVRAVPVKKATDTGTTEKVDASAAWVACAEGDADCEGWKCYTLNDDGTTATQNGWRKYDQAKCQTFDIEAGAHEGVSNTFYWRLVTDVSTENETITETRTETYVDDDGVTKTREVTVDLYDGKKFGWVVLSKTDCESTTNDVPKAGDTIVLDGHRMFASGDADGRDQYNDESRTNVMMLETTGTEDGTLPRIVALTGIVDYKHWDGVNQYSNTVFILSPKEVVFVSSSFKFMSASGDPITLVNFRGNWADGTKYGYYDQVSHNDSIWTCIVKKGDTTNAEPSDTSTDWRKEISGGKGEKGDKGDPGTPGNGIDRVETRFFAWKSDKFGTGFDSDRVWEDGSTTMPADFSDDFPWLWQVTRTYYTNGTDVLGEAVCIGYKGKDAVTYGVQVSSYSEWISSGNKLQGLQFGFTKTIGTTVEKYTDVTKMGCTVKVYGDDTLYDNVSGWINEGNDHFLFSSFPYNNVVGNPTLADKSVISVELYHDYVLLATANYANGKQGADGIGAFEILCDPETIVIDTDDNGLATGLDNAYASLMCLRDGKEVSGVTYNIGEHDTVNCDATVNNNGIVTITSVTSQSVTIGGNTVTVSSTSGSVTVSVKETATSLTYTKTVPFAVNVARYTGGLKADNKKFESAYNYLTNDGNSTDFKLFESKIRQTAKEISLKVSEKSVGRRNLLPGSALRKQDEGVELNLYGNTSNGEGIVVNNGIDGVNALKVTTKSTNQYTGLYWRANASKSQQVKIKRNTKYTASVWVKCSNTSCHVQIECIYHASANDINRISQVFRTVNYPTLKAGEWQLFTAVLSTGADYDYMECNFWAMSASGTTVLFCKPMLEEGEEYNGWTLSEQDYDYVGGNLLDGTGTLAKTGNVEVLDGTVTQGGMGESASIRATLSPTAQYVDFLQYSTSGMGLNVGEDCMLSFYARAASGYAHGELQCYLYYPSTGNVMTESSHEKLDFLWNPSDGDLHTHITPPTAWKRYWVHWRPMGNVPQHILFRLVRPGTYKESYDPSTSYNVGDVVVYGGTYYVCQKAGSGYEPGASSYWEATVFAIEIARPKLEVGATMTEWTEKRADMVDKQALYATGIDIDSKKITLTADNTTFRGNDGKELAKIDRDGLRVPKMVTTDTGHGHTVIEGNTTVWFQKDGVTPGIAVFYDAAGVPHLAFYGTDGKQKYDIGPSGLQSLISSIQRAHSDTAYLRDATGSVYINNSTLKGFEWLYVASGEKNDMRYIYRKQIPTTDASKNYDIYDGCVFTKEYSGMNWPNGGNLLPNGWYVEPNDGNLPIKLHTADEDAVFDPTKTLYYQTFYYYEGGKVARTVRAYMKRSTKSDQLLSKFEYAMSYDEIL